MSKIKLTCDWVTDPDALMPTSFVGALLISLCSFGIGYWAWPPGMFLAPISILSVGNLTWAALSLCFWIGGFRHLQAYVKKERGRQEPEVQASEIKIVIPCPYCDFKLRIPAGRRLQVTCPNPVCKKDFNYGNVPEKTSFRDFIFTSFLIICFSFFAYFFAPYWAKSHPWVPPLCSFPGQAGQIYTEPISPAQCSENELFWCLVSNEVGDATLSCKALLSLTNEDKKKSLYTSDFVIQVARKAANKP